MSTFADANQKFSHNPQYEAIFNPRNIDEDCNKIADEINEDIMIYDIGQESRRLLEEGHKEILQSECYQEYGYPSYINR